MCACLYLYGFVHMRASVYDCLCTCVCVYVVLIMVYLCVCVFV